MTLFGERRLVARIAAGDRTAFQEYLDAYGDRVHRLTRRYARSVADAEDLTQEIFVDLFRSMASFRGDSRLMTWTYRVAMNHCLRYRERLKPSTVPFDEACAGQSARVGDPQTALDRSELSSQLHDALDTLSTAHRDVVYLHELHGLTYQECAKVLDVPVGTVKSRLSTAFGRLRQSLSGYVLDEGSALAPVSERGQ